MLTLTDQQLRVKMFFLSRSFVFVCFLLCCFLGSFCLFVFFGVCVFILFLLFFCCCFLFFLGGGADLNLYVCSSLLLPCKHPSGDLDWEKTNSISKTYIMTVHFSTFTTAFLLQLCLSQPSSSNAPKHINDKTVLSAVHLTEKQE